MPWHLTYEGFEGTLPGITGIRLLLRPSFMTYIGLTGLCLYEGNVQAVAKVSRGVVSAIMPDGTVPARRTNGSATCAETGFFSLEGAAVSTATELGTATALTVRLI